jgi:pyruvate/2-oxoglutarate dehydrogenase complex dihydrolipoamide dehydrogenase (E3) component
MTAARSYDAIVIGAGQGGKPLSMVLARAGLKTAVIEVNAFQVNHAETIRP